jgi:uncharacterized LabA/DUF88 family protein
MRSKTYCFIDAANLFYGGEKSLGWKIDYKKLIKYIREKYKTSKVFYYAGIETHKFPFSVLDNSPINLKKLHTYLLTLLKSKDISEEEILLITIHIKRVKFYMKLEQFGYELQLKPTKVFWNEGKPIKKANCDVDMTLDMVRYMEQYGSALILSGDGDFAKALQYLVHKKREIYVLARGERTAKEIKLLVGADFRDFSRLRTKLEFTQ